MFSFPPPLLILPSKFQTTKCLRGFCFHLCHSLPPPNSISQFTGDRPVPRSVDNPPTSLSTHLSDCTNLSELNRVYARIIRTHFLEQYSAAFYYNNIIRCYARLGHPTKGLLIYFLMSRASVLPDCYTIPLALKCVCQVYNILMGKVVHGTSIKIGLANHEFCETGFISLYSKAGEFENARKIFDENSERKLGSWNAVIGGLTQGGRALEAIALFIEMKRCGFRPDDVTMVSVTSACASIGNLSLSEQLHKCVLQTRTGEKSDVLMFNSLVDMYGKCGRMDLAYMVFSRMEERNVSSWTSMIVGYAMHGHIRDAIECFEGMREAGVWPNHVTFVGVLSACVHGGMVQEGKYYFHMMENEYGIVPGMQHYGCMVDLLGKSGLFDEAREMIMGMPMNANSAVWGCLMGACEKFGNVEMGEWVASYLQELEPWNDGVFVVLSNIYANRGLWDKAQNVRKIMKEKKLAKIPAYSSTTR